MSSAGSARVPKRRRTTKTSEAADRQLRERQFLDLNLFPAVEVASTGGSLSINEPVSRTQPPPTAAALLYETTQVVVSSAAAGSNIGMNSFPINVEVIDDDVAIYTSGPPPQFLFQARQQSFRTGPITVIIDDDSETTAGPAGEALDEHVNTLLSLGMNPRHNPSRAQPNTDLVINIVDTPETNKIPPKVVQAVPEPVKEIPKETKFSCPVCMNELVNASSTICGHIFCQKCIKASIQAQKKCPTCRRKLTMSNFHRVYLPTADN
uniref:RING-type domain-containing protein n=1 Tax=Triticum urartu TaxID=4572 RepID=A0A8R7U102_TRIUA